MKKIKNLLVVVMVMTFALVLAACGSDKDNNNNNSKETSSNNNTETSDSKDADDSNEETSAGASIEEIKANGKVRIGVFSDKHPFGYVDEDGEFQGYDVYFARRIAKELLGDEDAIEWVIVEPANRVEFLEADKVDIILANFTVTDERAEKVDFTLPYMKVALGVVSPEGDVISEVSELEGKDLIVVKGTTAETYFEENHPEVNLVKYDQISEAYQALQDGRGVAFSQDNTLLLAWVQENEGYEVGISSLGDIDTIAPAVQKGNTELKDWIDDLIKALADEAFFHADYDETLKPVYGDTADPEEIVIEGGVIE